LGWKLIFISSFELIFDVLMRLVFWGIYWFGKRGFNGQLIRDYRYLKESNKL
jgi:hypothetical protein